MANQTTTEQPLGIGILGHGPIARYVIEQVFHDPLIRVIAVISRESSLQRAQEFANGRFPVHTAIKEMIPKPDLVVDCAGHAGLTEHGPAALEAGIDVISISTGALATVELPGKLEKSARTGGSSIRFLSGAVGGIDSLLAARIGGITEVRYIGRKPPPGWLGSHAEQSCDLDNLEEPFVHFSGTAREAARLYPANANVAATIALASTGLDSVSVELIADPGVSRNIHEIEASGVFGDFKFRIEGNPLADNPKSSALAAMSIVRELRQQVSPVRF